MRTPMPTRAHTCASWRHFHASPASFRSSTALLLYFFSSPHLYPVRHSLLTPWKTCGNIPRELRGACQSRNSFFLALLTLKFQPFFIFSLLLHRYFVILEIDFSSVVLCKYLTGNYRHSFADIAVVFRPRKTSTILFRTFVLPRRRTIMYTNICVFVERLQRVSTSLSN